MRLLHFGMGISRAPAAAFAVACARAPDRDEAAIAASLRSAAPRATPHRRVVALAHARLGRGGRMTRAIAESGRGREAALGAPFELDL